MDRSMKQKSCLNCLAFLPQELIEEIFLKLPINTLLTCTCVCKYWNSLIKSPNFLSNHLKLSLHLCSTQDPLSLISLRYADWQLSDRITGRPPLERTFFYLHFDNEGFNKYKQLHSPFQSSINQFFQTVGSINGLVCLAFASKILPNIDTTFILWNPTIRRFFTLPKPYNYIGKSETQNSFFGFGYDSHADDYKLIRIVSHCSRTQGELFSLNMSSWKTLTEMMPRVETDCLSSQAFVNGVVHRIVYRKRKQHFEHHNTILGFNVSDEVFFDIILPENLASVLPSRLSLFEYRGSTIAVLHMQLDYNSGNMQYHLWVMKDYNLVGPWTKSTLAYHDGMIPRPLGYRSNGDFLFRKGNEMVSYAVERRKTMNLIKFEGIPYYIYTCPYVESLVLLNKGSHVPQSNDTDAAIKPN